MGGEFALAVGVGVLFLYLPGYLFLRALRCTPCISFGVAPLVTLPLYAVLCVLYGSLGVYTSWATLVLPAVGMGVGARVVAWRRFSLRRDFSAGTKQPDIKQLGTKQPFVSFGPSKTHTPQHKVFHDRGSEVPWYAGPSFDLICLILYVAIGCVFGLFIFVLNLTSLDSLSANYDAILHLGESRVHLLTGNWSPFNTSLYAHGQEHLNPLPGAGFYPSSWHCVVTLQASLLKLPITLCANATNFLFASIVYPISTFILLRTLFKNKPHAVLAGAFLTCALAAFPWGFIFFGPLYANLAATSLVPAFVFLFLEILAPQVCRTKRLRAGGLFVVGCLCMAFTHPNAVFMAAVFVAPYCLYRISQLAEHVRFQHVQHKKLLRLSFFSGALLVFALIWIILYKAPFLSAVIHNVWYPYDSFARVAFDAATLGFRTGGVQLPLAVLLFVGMVQSCVQRNYLWLTVAFLAASTIFVVNGTMTGLVQRLFSGFWYNDTWRTAAMAAVFAVPLIALGATTLADLLARLVNRCSSGAVVVVALIAISLSIVPFHFKAFEYDYGNALSSIASDIAWTHANVEGSIYTQDEQEFVDEVKQIVPEGVLIINSPSDGSVFAFGAQGLNIYYRYGSYYGKPYETRDSINIRTCLRFHTSNKGVKTSVDSVGAEYVLLLDQGNTEEQYKLWSFARLIDWTGIDDIRDDTPGFEVVLAQDDMRLYRIVDTEEDELIA